MHYLLGGFRSYRADAEGEGDDSKTATPVTEYVERRWSVPSPQNSPALECPHRLCQRSIRTDAVKLRRFARDCVRITRCVHNLPDGTIEFTEVSPVPEGTHEQTIVIGSDLGRDSRFHKGSK
jgi:hypothetical protein